MSQSAISPALLLPSSTAISTPWGGRMVLAALFLVVWIALGFALHLGAEAYLVLGVPLALGFQVLVARRRVTEAWVRGGTSLRLDKKGIGLLLALASVQATNLAYGFLVHRASMVFYGLAGCVGAFGLVAARRTLASAKRRETILSTLAAAAPGLVIMAVYVLRWAPASHSSLTLALILFAGSFVQYVPVCFAMEEVVFRGVLDPYVATSADGARRRWIAATVLSVAWGLWHLPIIPVGGTGFAAFALAAAKLSLVHLPVGLALTAASRRTGSLLVPAVAHSLIDAFRNALM